MEIVRLLERAGVEARLISREIPIRPSGRMSVRVDAVLDLEVDGKKARFVVEVKERTPYPGELQRLAPLRDAIESMGVPLLVAPFVSEATGKALTEAKWSWADAQGNADIRAEGVRIIRRMNERAPKHEESGFPTGKGSWAIIRSLVADGEADGVTELANRIGVSQPRVSQVLSRLTAAGYLERKGRSTWTADRSALLDAFLRNYPGSRGTTNWFFSLDAPHHTCDQFVSVARSTDSEVAVSGDVAADRLMPWRAPTHLTMYFATHHLTTHITLETAIGPGDGNVEVIVPSDTSVFLPFGSGDPLTAHPTQVIWDLQRLGGSDRFEAAERLSEWLLSR